MKPWKSTYGQSGYALIDVLFAIVMPGLIILAIVTVLTRANIPKLSPDDSNELTQLEPRVFDFADIHATPGYRKFYDFNNRLIFFKNSMPVYSEDNVMYEVYAIDTKRPNATVEFYSKMESELHESGFSRIGGASEDKIRDESLLEFARVYQHRHIDRTCLLYSKEKSKNALLLCADSDEKSLKKANSFAENDFTGLLAPQYIYVHNSFGPTYYGNEPDGNHIFEFAAGKIYAYKLIDNQVIVDYSTEESAVFWRDKESPTWNLLIDTNIGDEQPINCDAVDRVHSSALPKKVCTDNQGNVTFLKDYYEQ